MDTEFDFVSRIVDNLWIQNYNSSPEMKARFGEIAIAPVENRGMQGVALRYVK